MILIIKGAEPKKWIAKRNTPGFTKYESDEALRKALLKDQGHICGYCMRLVPVIVADPGISQTSKIEHIKSRKEHPDLELEYSNMIICCPGYINSSDHCDKSKSSREISFSPFDPALEKSISYASKDGSIKSANPKWDEELNEVLMLNNTMLKLNRYQILDGLHQILVKRKWKKKEMEEQYKAWKATDQDGKHRAYCGVVISYLEKKIRQSQG